MPCHGSGGSLSNMGEQASLKCHEEGGGLIIIRCSEMSRLGDFSVEL